MNSIRLLNGLICCSLLLAGCNMNKRQNVQQIELSEVVFLIPLNYSVTNAEEIEDGAVFEFEGVWGELRNRRLVVMGEDYGVVKAGDEVRFQPSGTVLVNGTQRNSAGLGDSAIENGGVLYYFPRRNVTKSTNEEGTCVVEIADGKTYELTKLGIIIEGHEYGPFSPGTVVKIAPDGSVAFNP